MNIPEMLLPQIEGFIEKGDEQGLEAFLLEHYEELPEELQQKLFTRVFSEAIGVHDPEVQRQGLQLRALDALKEIEEIRAAVAAQAKE